MDLKHIRNLIRLVEESGVNEVSIQEGDFSIKIKKQDGVVLGHPQHAPAMQVTIPASASAPPAAPAESASKPASSAAAGGFDGFIQKSPIVGSFYTAPSPDAKPYVNIGDRVKKGQTLCIIEAMKIMNEIESDVDGIIESILVANAQSVEYDQPLFAIRQA